MQQNTLKIVLTFYWPLHFCPFFRWVFLISSGSEKNAHNVDAVPILRGKSADESPLWPAFPSSAFLTTVKKTLFGHILPHCALKVLDKLKRSFWGKMPKNATKSLVCSIRLEMAKKCEKMNFKRHCSVTFKGQFCFQKCRPQKAIISWGLTYCGKKFTQ